MNGYKFYLEYPNAKEKRKATRRDPGNHNGNVIATWGNPYPTANGPQVEAMSAVFYSNNSGVAVGAVALDYLSERCKRISETQARDIHPALFERLDYEPDKVKP